MSRSRCESWNEVPSFYDNNFPTPLIYEVPKSKPQNPCPPELDSFWSKPKIRQDYDDDEGVVNSNGGFGGVSVDFN
jgi:hypothetical protein